MKSNIVKPKVAVFVFSVLAAGMNSCNVGDDIQLPFVPALYGSWNWVESVGGFAGRKITPETEGHTLRYTFLLYGEFEEHHDGKPFAKSRYTVKRQVLGRDTVDVLTLDHSPSMLNILRFAGNDTLTLTEYCADCYNHTFVRVK